MSISSFDSSPYSQRQRVASISFASAIGYVASKWQEYRLMRSIESVPYEVMKDVGFPAAERAHEM